MATTLNRQDTDKFFSFRTQVNESGTNGDTWRWLFSYSGISDTDYNNLVDTYEAWETLADNSQLTGTNPSGGTFGIGVAPQRPHPPKRT